jgi:AraC-like DNA-binding protein
MDNQGQLHRPNQADSASLWRVEVFGGLELLRAHFAKFTFSLHAHEEFMIVVTASGVALPQLWGSVHRVGAGDIFVLSPNEVHGGGPAEDSIWCYRSFYLPSALMQRVAQEFIGGERGLPQFTKTVVNDPQLATQLYQAHQLLEEPHSVLACETYLVEALATLIERHAVSKAATPQIGVEHQAVKVVKAYLETLPAENVSLETLAQEAGLSPFRLCRVFRRETGLSPHAYQILVRVRLAKALLMKGIPIAQAAVAAGFFDQAHLTRHFKRIFGVTPGHYLGGMLPPAV